MQRSCHAILTLALLCAPLGAEPLPAPIDELGRSTLVGFVFEGPENAGVVLDALRARVEGLDPATRDDLRAAAAWLAERCPYNRALHATSSAVGAALDGPLAPLDAAGVALSADARRHLVGHRRHLARLGELHDRHLRLLGALGLTLAPARGGSAAVASLNERLGGIRDEVDQLDPTRADGIAAATATLNGPLADQWPLKLFLFVYADTLKAAADDARGLAALSAAHPTLRARSLAFAAHAEDVRRMIERLTSLYC